MACVMSSVTADVWRLLFEFLYSAHLCAIVTKHETGRAKFKFLAAPLWN
ncbi:unnamed protein product, partial [Callosobruchus maculatus]